MSPYLCCHRSSISMADLGKPRSAICLAYVITESCVTPLWSRAHVHQIGCCTILSGGDRPGRGIGASALVVASLTSGDTDRQTRRLAVPSSSRGATRHHGCTTPSSSHPSRLWRRSMRSPASCAMSPRGSRGRPQFCTPTPQARLGQGSSSRPPRYPSSVDPGTARPGRLLSGALSPACSPLDSGSTATQTPCELTQWHPTSMPIPCGPLSNGR
mmetsp:Transcript_2635/g.7138  ORF Transcript_2635/g.7138 Transcript_2635/m.7138 type:complete len:214 (+) Transcript_2635:1287-1928(+)